MKIAFKTMCGCFLLVLIPSGFVWAACDSCPNGVSVEKIISRFAESLQSHKENVVLVRKLTDADIRKIKFDEFFINKNVSDILNSGQSIQFFEVFDKIKGDSKYLAYAAKIGITAPNAWNRGLTHFFPPEDSEWLIIAGPSPVSSEDIGGVKFIEIPDEAAGVISAATGNKLGVDAKVLLSDLKMLSSGTKLSGKEVGRLKTAIGQAIYKLLPSTSR
jgi:hypothetical protein